MFRFFGFRILITATSFVSVKVILSDLSLCCYHLNIIYFSAIAVSKQNQRYTGRGD